VGGGDVTTLALIPTDLPGSAELRTRGELVVAGVGVAAEVFARCGAELRDGVPDGTSLGHDARIASVVGPAAAILTGERTALNFLQRLSGIATHTRRFVTRAQQGSSRVQVVDTRKTTPGWRTLEKYAVRCGGGVNHRVGLFDGVLIKDNHIAAVGSVGAAVRRARERAPLGLRIQVEVESLEQAREALDAGADFLLVDNQSPQDMEKFVSFVAGRVPVEASGGVTLETIADYARTGVDRISIGALTHSAPAADISLEWLPRSAS